MLSRPACPGDRAMARSDSLLSKTVNIVSRILSQSDDCAERESRAVEVDVTTGAAGQQGPENAVPEPPSRGTDVVSCELREQLAEMEALSHGRLQMISRDELRERLGDQWEAVAGQFHTIARKTIEQRLTKADKFFDTGEAGYLILFDALKREQARIQRGLIAEEVIEALLHGSATGDVARKETGATDADGRLMPQYGNAWEAIWCLLENEAESATETPTETRIADGWQTAGNTEQRSLPSASAAAQAAARRETLALSDLGVSLSFSYKPVWHPRRGAILTYRCMASVGPKPLDQALAEVFPAGDVDLGLRAELDLSILGQVTNTLRRLAALGKKLLLVCQCHFQTLDDPRTRSAYMKRCEDLPPSLRGFLVIEILGASGSIPQARLSGAIAGLTELCRAVNLRVASEVDNVDSFRGLGIHALGLDLEGMPGADGAKIPCLERFSTEVNRSGFHKFAYGIDSGGLATAAIRSGYDYIGGAVAGDPVDFPENAYRFETPGLPSGTLGSEA